MPIIRSRLGDHAYVKMGAKPLQPDDRGVEREGPVRRLTGIFQRELGDRQRVLLVLEAIEYQVWVLIRKRFLRPVTEVV